MSKFTKLLMTSFLGLLLIVPGYSQTALTSTTLSEAVDATETDISVASTTGVAVNDIALVDGEAMLVTRVDTDNNIVYVQRGYAGTFAEDHSNSRIIYFEPADRYIDRIYSGSCTAATEYPNFTPLINPSSGKRYACVNSRWVEVVWQEVRYHDTEARDFLVIFDGNAQDFSFGIDDSADDFVLVTGTALGTDNIVAFPNIGTTTSGQRAIWYGENPATAADNDESYLSFFAEDDAGQSEQARLTWRVLDVTNTTNDVEFRFDAQIANTLTNVLQLGSTGAGGTTGQALFTADIVVEGTTPSVEVGDGGAEDAQINFDGNATDFSLGLDDSADSIVLADETALGTDNLFEVFQVGTGTSVQRSRFYGANPATAADNDETYVSFFAEDDSPAQIEIGRLTWRYLDVSAASDDSDVRISAFVGNTLATVFTVGSDGAGGTFILGAFPSRDNGNDSAGNSLTVGYNTNATNANPGTVNLLQLDGGAGYVWGDNSANPGVLRIHTSAPAGASADTDGTVVGAQTSWWEDKYDIRPNSPADWKSALDTILTTPLYHYGMRADGYDRDYYGFVIFEQDRGSWFSWNDAEGQKPSLNERNILGHYAAAFKELNRRLSVLEGNVN